MRLLQQSLRGRLLASAAVFIVLALLATGLAVGLALHRFVQGQIDQRLDAQLLTIEAALEAGPDGTVRLGRTVDGPPFDNPRTGWFWLARTPTHTWMAGGIRSSEVRLPVIPPGAFEHPRPFVGQGPDGRPVRLRADHVDVAGHDVVVVVAAPLAALNGPLRDAMVPLATALAVLGIGLILATLLQVRLGLRPLVALHDSLTAVRTGESARLPTRQPDEVRPLVEEMNSLLEQHDINLDRARRHVANLAHALKTPLAALTLELARLERDPDGSLRGLTIAMDRRIRHHLARARTAALGTAARTRLPLAPRIADHVDAFKKIYADKRVDCRMAVPDALAVACDPQDFDEVVGNLLDNGFKWCRAAVRVEAAIVDGRVCLVVSDDGRGVAHDQFDVILQPGKRLDERIAGDGFGLAIVTELTELYGGVVALAPSDLGGLAVKLTLPSASDGSDIGAPVSRQPFGTDLRDRA